jgi:hypothetical protein
MAGFEVITEAGLDREAYLRDALSRTADHPINRIEELLPWSGALEPTPDSGYTA